MLTGSIIVLFLYSIVGLRSFSITSVHDIDDVFRYLTFGKYICNLYLSHMLLLYNDRLWDSLYYSICNVWHYFHYSGLSRDEFLQHTRSKNLFWECPKCVVYRWGKCSRVLGKCGCILCNRCNEWFHKRCSLLDEDIFVKLGQCEEPRFCLECMTNNLPFYTLDKNKNKKLFNMPNKKLEKAIEGIPWCKICNKKSIYLSTAIKC